MEEKTVQDPHPSLREVATDIPLEGIETPEIQNLIKTMKKAMYTHDDGGVNVGLAVAIAAPQIAVSKRVFVVAGHSFLSHEERHSGAEAPDDEVFINPVIVKRSSKKEVMQEGCLSVNHGNSFGKVERYQCVTVQAYDETGQKFEYGACGFMAQVFQHEIDHLDGILFIDTAEDIKTYTKDDTEKES